MLTWVGHDLPIEIDWPAIGESNDLDHNIGCCQNRPEYVHDLGCPRKSLEHALVKDHHHTFLQPDAAIPSQ